MTGFAFAESMAGTATDGTAGRDHPFAFSLRAESPTAFNPRGVTLADARGTLDLAGLADSAPAWGWLELSPFAERRMRYVLDFTGSDGVAYRFDGRKQIRPWSAASWTTLHGEIRTADGELWGKASAYFSLRRQLLGLIASMRPHRPRPHAEDLVARRWRGQPGRLEVWYATLTDPRTGEGFWFHHELLAPCEGEPRRQGWAAAFPAGAQPAIEHFGAEDAPAGTEPGAGVPAFEAAGVSVRAGSLRGAAGSMKWDLRYADDSPPLFTFPAATWRRELLPASQIVPAPQARFSGTVDVGDRQVVLEDAPGNLARIYGHGNAERWGWLHADLGDGDVLEIVAAVSRRPGLNRLPPLAFVQLRADGRDWPRNPLIAAARMRTRLHEHGFVTEGRFGRRRLRADVTLDPAESVVVAYDDTHGGGPACTNSERASADVLLEQRSTGGAWHTERHWTIERTAHAELGVRPA